jgi:DNA-binding transcriptional MerR regulator
VKNPSIGGKAVSLRKSTFEKIFGDPEYGTFSSFQVVKILQIKKERLQEWLHKGFIAPETRASGRGTRNRFSQTNLYEIALFDYLLDRGLSRKESAKILKTDIMDLKKQFLEKTLKMVNDDIQYKSITPTLIIFKTGDNYSSKVIFEKEIIFDINQDISDRNLDEIQIINIDKIIKNVNRAVRLMD